jgi:hypothetical protein
MTDTRTTLPPLQLLLIAFDSTRLRAMSPTERRQAVTCLARLLLEAQGLGAEGQDDDR